MCHLREARRRGSRRSPPWGDVPQDVDHLLVSAPGRNELAVTIHSVSLLSSGNKDTLQPATGAPEDLRESGHHSREGTHLVAHPLSNEKRSPIKRRLPLLPAMVN